MIGQNQNPMLKIGKGLKYTVSQMSLRKRKEIENLRPAFTSQIPSTLSIEIDLTQFGIRNDSSFFADSILDILCYSLSRVYRKFPKMNATYLDEKSYMEFDEIGIGIAMDDSDNLKVLALKKSETLSLNQVQGAIIDLLELYSSGKTIPLETFQSSITITDLSQTLVSSCVPTLSMGQASILAITRNRNGVFSLTCTYDHQVLAGRYVSEFLATELNLSTAQSPAPKKPLSVQVVRQLFKKN
jgi:pyruvate/2-oxoglutarate dehydrogenase complex dihydrolipoamide acyltransferase (E2) component